MEFKENCFIQRSLSENFHLPAKAQFFKSFDKDNFMNCDTETDLRTKLYSSLIIISKPSFYDLANSPMLC